MTKDKKTNKRGRNNRGEKKSKFPASTRTDRAAAIAHLHKHIVRPLLYNTMCTPYMPEDELDTKEEVVCTSDVMLQILVGLRTEDLLFLSVYFFAFGLGELAAYSMWIYCTYVPGTVPATLERYYFISSFYFSWVFF